MKFKLDLHDLKKDENGNEEKDKLVTQLADEHLRLVVGGARSQAATTTLGSDTDD
jgi:hypothetical protein